MNAIIIIGWKQVEGKGNVPESLYCGLVGSDAAKAADEAGKSGTFVRIGRITNPMVTPLPISPIETTSTGRPPERTKPQPTVKPAVQHVAEQLQQSEELREVARRARLALSEAESAKDTAVLTPIAPKAKQTAPAAP